MFSLSKYIDWHYYDIWPKMADVWYNAMLFPIYFFSVPLHLQTLFLPWKRQVMESKPGFDFGNIIGTVSFNLISRLLGAAMRSMMIGGALLFSFLILVIGAIVMIAWVIIPGLTIPLYLQRKPTEEELLTDDRLQAQGDLHQLLVSLFRHEQGQFIIQRLGFDPVSFQQMILSLPKHEHKADTEQYTQFTDIFIQAAQGCEPFLSFLSEQNLTLEDVKQTSAWYDELQRTKEQPLLLDRKRLKTIAGIGVDWAYGYTVQFDNYARDMTKEFTPYPTLIGRDSELDQMQRTLTKTQNNNVLIVGEPGTDRHILVETLAYRIFSGHCLPILSHKRILHVDMHAIISAKNSLGEIKGLLSDTLKEAEYAGNVIVFIDDMDRYVAGSEGRYDVTDVFEKFAHSNVAFIGITTPYAYHRYIEPNPDFAQLFEVMELTQPPKDIVLKQLEFAIIPVLEKKYNILITYPSLTKTISDAQRYLSETAFPGKAVELLDAACVMLTTIKKQYVLLPSHIDEYLSEKFHTPIGALQENEKSKLANLESLMHQRVINQETAIHAIAASLRRARLNVSSQNRPVGSFLFLGPTGVGKTETAKALAEVYYGNETAMLRFDMSEYKGQEGLYRLIGSVSSGQPGELTSKLTSHPFSLLLLDEIEKADKDIFNLFLSLVDEGYITNAQGRQINARNTIIIATSNAGAEFIRESIGSGIQGDALQKAVLEHIQTQGLFSPEFLNRFDGVIVFTPLSEGHMREVARLMLENLNTRLKEKEISVEITPDLITRLAIRGYEEREFGGRAMRRIITDTIEDQVTQRLLSGEAKKGQPIHIQL